MYTYIMSHKICVNEPRLTGEMNRWKDGQMAIKTTQK